MTSRIGAGVIATVAVALLVTACGGSGVGDPEGVADSDGDIEVAFDLPDYFPSDFYLPPEMTIKSVTRVESAGMIALTGTFESGDPAAIQEKMVSGLREAGYELLVDDDIAVFVRNGVGRVRVRTSVFLGELTLSVDIESWTDDQLDEMRNQFAEEITVPGRATAELGDERLDADGECILRGSSRSFHAEDVSITIQIDETKDPVYVYADVTMPDGKVFTIDAAEPSDYDSSPKQLSATGEMAEYNNEAAGTVPFSITATCDG